jgi:hypothetical protein
VWKGLFLFDLDFCFRWIAEKNAGILTVIRDQLGMLMTSESLISQYRLPDTAIVAGGCP